jgi:hypothetical protein
MKPNFCARESEVIAALLNDTLPSDLSAHVNGCETCSEIMQITHALQDVSSVSAPLCPPNARVVWQRAQSLAREHAIAKAMQPIRFARIGSLVAAASALCWLVLKLPFLFSSVPDLATHFQIADLSFSHAATGMLLLETIGGLFLIIFGSWYVLRQE